MGYVELEEIRKLVSIQKVLNIESIEGADNIEKATILGWACVVKKGDFKVGDLCAYFEIDSMIPNTNWSSFLFKGSDVTKDEFRLRTIRLRKQVSQGLAMPLDVVVNTISNETQERINESYLFEGQDITQIMGVTKYDPPIPAQLSGTMKGFRPIFIPKTDETRIQAEPKVLERHKGKIFYVTEKIDGSSMTAYLNNDEFGICSRKIDLKETEGNSFWKVARQLNLEEKLRGLKKNIAIQGELHGEGIQKNKYKLKGQDLVVFNIYDIDTASFLNLYEMEELAKQLALKTVPILERSYILGTSIKTLVEDSKGHSKLNHDTKREGIVLRPLEEERDSDLGRLSFKVINPDFLIKYGE